MSFPHNNVRNKKKCQQSTRDISEIRKRGLPQDEVTIFALRKVKLHLLDILITEDTMPDNESNLSDDLSKSLSSSSDEKESDGTQTSTTTDSSWSLAGKETKQVNRSKVLLLGVIAISAAVLGLFTFLIVDEDEEDDFQVAVSLK
jgi:hypothetical protein